MDNIIHDDVRQFILQHIDSIAQWEGLLLLRANRQSSWGAQAIARQLFIAEPDAVNLLQQLSQSGFVAIYGSGAEALYQYQVKNPEWESMIERCAELYRTRLIPMTNLIHSKSRSRIQEFADAFKLRRD